MSGRVGPGSVLRSLLLTLAVAFSVFGYSAQSVIDAPVPSAFAATTDADASDSAGSSASGSSSPGAPVEETSDAAARAAREPSIKVLTDASYYGPNDRFTLTIVAVNPTDEPIREARISLRVVPPRYSAETKPILERTLAYRAFLQPGESRFTFSRRARSIGRLGAYPMTATLRSRTDVISEDRNILSVIPEDVRPQSMDICIIWGMHLPGSFGADGVYVSSDLEERSLDLSRGIIDPLLGSPGMVLSVAPTPLALYQTAELAAGKGESSLPTSQPLGPVSPGVSPDSSAAGSEDAGVNPASTSLALLRMASDLGRIELLDTPFGNPSLLELGSRRWTIDVGRQLDRGRDVIEGVFPGIQGPRGFLAPDGAFAPDSLRVLSERGASYAVVSDAALPRRDRPSLAPFVHQEPESDPLTVVASASFASNAMSGIRDESDAQYAYGKMIEAFLWDRRRHGVAIAETDPEDRPAPLLVLQGDADPDIDPDSLQGFYRSIAATPWMRPSRLRDALGRSDSDAELLPQDARGRPSPTQKTRERYLERVAEARFDLKAMLQAAPEMGKESERLWRLIYMAQDVSWESSRVDSGAPSEELTLSRSWLDEVQRVVSRRLKGVTMDLRPVTLSGDEGKIPVVVQNESSGPLRLSLQGLGEGVRFPEGNDIEFVSAPGSEVIVIPVELERAGTHRIRVALRAGDKALAVRFAEISSLTFVPFLAGAAALVLVLIVALGVRRRRRKSS